MLSAWHTPAHLIPGLFKRLVLGGGFNRHVVLPGGETWGWSLNQEHCLGKENIAEMKRVNRNLEEKDKSSLSPVRPEKAAAQRAAMALHRRLPQGDCKKSSFLQTKWSGDQQRCCGSIRARVRWETRPGESWCSSEAGVDCLQFRWAPCLAFLGEVLRSFNPSANVYWCLLRAKW